MENDVHGHIQDLLIRCIVRKATDTDYEEAYDWIHSSDENRQYFNLLYSAWIASGLTSNVNEEVVRRVWNKVNVKHTNENKPVSHKQRRIGAFIKIAASLAVLIAIGIFSYKYYYLSKEQFKLYTVEAPKGSKSKITLADGTHVWLNAGSKLKYHSGYNLQTRDVYLSGEAYFEVAKSKSKPFKVHAGGIIVNALGTIFNIKAYPEEKIVETTLVEGLVKIEKITYGGKGNTQLTLKPNQHAVYYEDQLLLRNNKAPSGYSSPGTTEKAGNQSKHGEIILTEKVQPEIYTSWKDKRWVFSSETFGSFVLKLERLYDIRVIIEDAELKDYKLSGSIEEENIEMVLEALRLIIPIKYVLEHNILTIRLDKDLKHEFDQMLKKVNY